jgi:outer membrane assembly lipoprotein YfiO
MAGSRRFAAPLAGLLLLAGCGAGLLPAIHSEGERLSLARRLHDQGQCSQAIELFKTFIANAAGTAQVDEAIFLLGDCYLKTKEWTLAQGEFERLLRDYPESDSAAAAAFALGEALLGQSRPRDFDQEFTVKAIEQWRAYLRGYPGHSRNAEGERRLLEARTRLARKLVDTGELYLKLRLPQPARVYFRKVLEEYHDTPPVAEAELGLALADARQGRRAEAIEQFRSVETRYPGQPIAERAARERRRLERGRRARRGPRALALRS